MTEETTMPVPEYSDPRPMAEAVVAVTARRLKDAEATVVRQRALLREIQWNGPTVVHVMRRVGTCPACKSILTHDAQCPLDAEIKEEGE